MKKSKMFLILSLIVLIATAGALKFGYDYSIQKLVENSLIAVFTSSLIAIPNLLIAFSRQRYAVSEKIDKLIAALTDALNKDFPELTYGECTGEQLFKYEKLVASLVTQFSRTLSEEYYNVGDCVKQFLRFSFDFTDSIEALRKQIDDKDEFEATANEVCDLKSAMINNIEDIQGRIS